MNFTAWLPGGALLEGAAASERFWGLGPVGLAIVIFLVVFIGVVFWWLVINTGRRD
jgi:hypothetical protein